MGQKRQRSLPVKREFLPVKQHSQRLIALAIKRREKEYQDSQPDRAHNPFQIDILHLADPVLQLQCRADEIDGASPAEKSKDDVIRNILEHERGQGAFKRGRRTKKSIGNYCGRDG